MEKTLLLMSRNRYGLCCLHFVIDVLFSREVRHDMGDFQSLQKHLDVD